MLRSNKLPFDKKAVTRIAYILPSRIVKKEKASMVFAYETRRLIPTIETKTRGISFFFGYLGSEATTIDETISILSSKVARISTIV